MGFLQLIRPRQWLKNGFVFAGFLFAGHWNLGVLLQAIVGFCAFCTAASAIYIFNDICDREADKANPLKWHRPLVSGQVAQFDAELFMVFLIGAAISAAYVLGPVALVAICCYLLLNVGYSLGLKRIVLLDAFIIAAGFMLRIAMGTYAIGVPASRWLLLTGLMLTLFLAFCKRQAEKRYDCEQAITITAAATVMAYALYTVAPETMAYHHTEGLFYTVPFVIYGILRYRLLAGDDAAMHITTDPHLMLAGIGWLGLTTVLCWW